jgi:hypothetical protein
MASLLGNLIYAGLQTLLTTQAAFNALSLLPNLYSINTGMASGVSPDVALFQPSHAGALLSHPATEGANCYTMCPTLVTRTGAVSVWYNGNTTAVPGDILHIQFHSRIR